MHAPSRLQSAWQALYAADPAAAADAPPGASTTLLDARGRTRALVVGLARPAEWAALAAVWQAVQAEAGLPTPAIAVSGTDSFQLWFSLAEAIPAEEAHAFLDALRRHCLSDVDPARVTLLPSMGAAPAAHVDATGTRHARLIPARQEDVAQEDGERWSAFVAPDLAPMFDGTPWLDMPPNPEGQAELLSRLRSIEPAEWRAAQAWLQQANPMARPASVAAPRTVEADASQVDSGLDPHTFLRQVMNDATAPLALRIEAAKALLPHVPRSP